MSSFRRPSRASSGPALAVFLLVVAALLGWAPAARAACPKGNLLEGRAPHASRGTATPGLLSDGLLSWEGDDFTSPVATPMKGLRPFVEWDLGEPTLLVAFAVQADNNDVYQISTSVDGKAYSAAWTIGAVPDRGLRERVSGTLDVTARYVRLEAMSGDQAYAATEVRAYCELPVTWPPTRVVRYHDPIDAANVRGWQAQSGKLLLGLLSFPLLFSILPRLGQRRRRYLFGALFVLAALAWTHFGKFNGDDPLHTWDSFHYFMGTKYFPETGYTDLYRCGAVAERENGQEAIVDRTVIRDVETNLLHPGDWTRTDAGRCRAVFSAKRWDAFKDDLNGFRELFVGHTIVDSFSDHGFNATPIYVAFVRPFTKDAPVTRARLTWLAQIDSLALVGTVAMLTWGFGPLAGVVAALALGLGGMWSYHWVGGCLARHPWLFFVASGVALLNRERYALGGVALTVSGLLRLFPFVFVGAAGLWLIVNMVRERRISAAGRRFLAGSAIAFAVGVGAAGASVGFDSYSQFSHVFDRHSHSAMTNQFGLTTLLVWTAGEDPPDLLDPRLTNPYEKWETTLLRHRAERRPLWIAGIAISLAVIVLSAAGGATAAECVAASGLLLFCLLPMTSYDYTWVVIVVALAKTRPKILPALLAFAVFTLFLFVVGGEAMGTQHVLGSIACLSMLASAVPWRDHWEHALRAASLGLPPGSA